MAWSFTLDLRSIAPLCASAMSEKRIVVGLGELLWDIFPNGKLLGGAPANFAYITNLLGNTGVPASRLGCDPLGGEARERLSQLGLTDEYVQEDPIYPTGTVKVEVDKYGQPQFEILHPVAWDFLEWNADWKRLAQQTDAVCFGSLAQRSPQSRSTIRSFLSATRPQTVRVFDVNLRQNFYSKEIIEHAMDLATIVKLNHEELPILMSLLGVEHRNEQESAWHLLSSYELKLICVTRGNEGSLLLCAAQRSEHPGFQVKVADTVGAGDAFTAALVHGYLRGDPLDEINQNANRVGAWVASQPGATPSPKLQGLEHTLAEVG